MCRFLLVKSKEKIDPSPLLHKFSLLSEKSLTFDGDRHKDGWGISWLDKVKNWKLYRSLKPLWEDTTSFQNFPKTNMFCVHVRSATNKQKLGNVKYNQPYALDELSFVFNGVLKSIDTSKLPFLVRGDIGAQKIWYLLQKYLKKHKQKEALNSIKDLLIRNSKKLLAINIGLASTTNICALCYFKTKGDYHKLRYFDTNGLKMICSEELKGYKMIKFKPGEVIVL